jgi:DNA-binding transcriptional LysR family regulator
MAAILSPVMEKFTRQYPRVLLRTYQVTRPLDDPGLRGRSLDFTLGHFAQSLPDYRFIEDVNVEVLFDDRLVVAAGVCSPWAKRRRKFDLAELVDEPWILAEAPNSWNYSVVAEAFRVRGLRMPKVSLMTFSVHLRMGMLASGHFITTFPNAIPRFHPERRSIKVLPVDLPDRRWPVVITTLKNRTLNPVVERFIAHIREFTRPLHPMSMAGHKAVSASAPLGLHLADSVAKVEKLGAAKIDARAGAERKRRSQPSQRGSGSL